MTVMRGRIVAAALAALLVPAAGAASGQDAPRTPDLQGVWDFKTATPLERPEDPHAVDRATDFRVRVSQGELRDANILGGARQEERSGESERD